MIEHAVHCSAHADPRPSLKVLTMHTRTSELNHSAAWSDESCLLVDHIDGSVHRRDDIRMDYGGKKAV